MNIWMANEVIFFTLFDSCQTDVYKNVNVHACFLWYLKSYENWEWGRTMMLILNAQILQLILNKYFPLLIPFSFQPLNIPMNIFWIYCFIAAIDWHRVHWIHFAKWHLNDDKIEMGQWSTNCSVIHIMWSPYCGQWMLGKHTYKYILYVLAVMICQHCIFSQHYLFDFYWISLNEIRNTKCKHSIHALCKLLTVPT